MEEIVLRPDNSKRISESLKLVFKKKELNRSDIRHKENEKVAKMYTDSNEKVGKSHADTNAKIIKKASKLYPYDVSDNKPLYTKDEKLLAVATTIFKAIGYAAQGAVTWPLKANYRYTMQESPNKEIHRAFLQLSKMSLPAKVLLGIPYCIIASLVSGAAGAGKAFRETYNIIKSK